MTPHPDPHEPNTMPEETREILRTWAASPAPGEDRLAAMPVPPLPAVNVRPRRSKRFAYFAQAAAGIALFVAGFTVGTNRESSPPQIASAPPISVTTPPPAPAILTPSPTPDPTPPAPAVASVDSPVQIAAEECKSPQVYQGTDGRIRINTVLCKTGSHMTWVVNPRLEVAKLSTPSSSIQEN